MEKIVIDTNMLIDLMRNVPKITDAIKRLENENELCTTDINAFELYWGAYKSRQHEKEMAAVKDVLGALALISTTEKAMNAAAKIIAELEKKGKAMDLRDLFIGSICIANSFKLLTRNAKHFENMEGLEVMEAE